LLVEPNACSIRKSFWFFFSKKTCLTYSSCVTEYLKPIRARHANERHPRLFGNP
jgi:hypothetical protein